MLYCFFSWDQFSRYIFETLNVSNKNSSQHLTYLSFSRENKKRGGEHFIVLDYDEKHVVLTSRYKTENCRGLILAIEYSIHPTFSKVNEY